jgi:hypothetical protein
MYYRWWAGQDREPDCWRGCPNCGHFLWGRAHFHFHCYTSEYYLDDWTEHLAVPFAERPTNAQGSSGCFINTFQIFYPDMFRHVVDILSGSWVPDKLLKQCSVLWACADYDPSRVASCRGQLVTRCAVIHNIISTAHQLSISQKALGTHPDDGNLMPKRIGATIHN